MGRKCKGEGEEKGGEKGGRGRGKREGNGEGEGEGKGGGKGGGGREERSPPAAAAAAAARRLRSIQSTAVWSEGRSWAAQNSSRALRGAGVSHQGHSRHPSGQILRGWSGSWRGVEQQRLVAAETKRRQGAAGRDLLERPA
jgi:hypothetical protein